LSDAASQAVGARPTLAHMLLMFFGMYGRVSATLPHDNPYWRARHPEAAAHLEPADVLVDAMRGRFHTWTRVRLNLQHVPEGLRPPQEDLDPNDDPWSPGQRSGR